MNNTNLSDLPSQRPDPLKELINELQGKTEYSLADVIDVIYKAYNIGKTENQFTDLVEIKDDDIDDTKNSYSYFIQGRQHWCTFKELKIICCTHKEYQLTGIMAVFYLNTNTTSFYCVSKKIPREKSFGSFLYKIKDLDTLRALAIQYSWLKLRTMDIAHFFRK